MSRTYTIETVVGRREWTGQYGPNVSYDLRLTGVSDVVELTRKPEKPAPQVGETLTGTLEDGYQGKKKFKVERQGGFGGGGGRSPEESARITRQHSQEMALRYAAIRAQQGKLPDTFSLADLKIITDKFDEDAKGAQP